MKKILVILVSICLFFCNLLTPVKADTDILIESVIANEELIEYAKDISKKHFFAVKDDLEAFGFENKNINTYKLGNYFTIYNYVSDEIVYEFAILSNNNIVGLLEVTEVDGEYNSFLGQSFAKEIDKFFKQSQGQYKIITDGSKIFTIKDNLIELLYTYYDNESINFHGNYNDIYTNKVTFNQSYSNLTENTTSLFMGLMERGNESQPLSYKTLNVKGVPQNGNTCWAATCAAIINYLKSKNLTFYNVSSFIHPNAPYDPGSEADCIRAYNNWNVTANATGRISFANIKSDINNNKPIHFSLTGTGAIGHAVGVIGYEDWTDSDILILLEPNGGVRKTATINSSGGLPYTLSGTTYYWTRTIRFS